MQKGARERLEVVAVQEEALHACAIQAERLW